MLRDESSNDSPFPMSLCILTDNTAHFPPSTSSGKHLIHILPLRGGLAHVAPPTVEDFLSAFHELERSFKDILVLTTSAQLVPVADVARQAAVQHGGLAQINVLDSQQTGAALGLLAQVGVQAALDGSTLDEVKNRIRAAMVNTYTLICCDPASGFDHIGDEDGLPFAIYSIEEGRLSLYKRVRTRRHLMETFLEFLEEFESPNYIVFSHAPRSLLRAKPLRDIARERFRHTPFTELEMNSTLTSLFGLQAVGLTIMEMNSL